MLRRKVGISFLGQLRKGASRALGLTVLSIAGAGVLLVGCEDEIVSLPPSAPDGVFSITGDGQVTICWNSNPEPNIAGNDIYWNDMPTGAFERIGSVGASSTCFIDTDVDNGTTYFYAVAAVNDQKQESELSFEDVFDTPRPEDFGLVLHDYLGQNSALSGYDFSSLSNTAQPDTSAGTDVYFGPLNGVPTLFGKGVAVGTGVDIQDYGYIDLESVDWAPANGWSPAKKADLVEGHSYIVQIEETGGFYHYAKVYVVSATSQVAVLDWAYQVDPGNPELTPGIGGAQK